VDDIRPADESDNGQDHAPETNGETSDRFSPTPEELQKQLDEAERELAKTRAERDEYKAAAYSFLGQLIPYEPMTPEEAHEMMYGPRGQPIIEIIEELERELKGGSQ
jgi:hypothetical protein